MSDALPMNLAQATPVYSKANILPLRVRDLSLSLGGTVVLDGVDLDLGPHGCTMIMGPNGAGKSQFLKLLHGLVKADHGTIEWGGKCPGEVTSRQALVFQKPVLLRRTVAANLDFVLKARGLDRSKGRTLLDYVGLSHKATQPARLLSGGEAQRLALARALATNPEVLLLDEPTASLDPVSVMAIERIVADARDRGVRVLFVTHDPGQARRMGDDIVFLHRGKIAEHSDAGQFFNNAQSPVAQRFLNGGLVV